jgi:hypothetical protein
MTQTPALPHNSRNSRLELHYLPIQQLTPDPKNPRKHPKAQIKALSSSIAALGFNVPLLVDADDRVIAGHARLEAAHLLNMTELPVIRVEHLSETQRKAFMLADNKLAEAARWDERLLGEILLDLSSIDLDFEIEATGFSMAEIDLMIEGLETDDDIAAEDQPPTGPSICQPGDLWQLGNHRLICASSLKVENWCLLMGDERAQIVVTDPPYNVKIHGHVSGLGKARHREFMMASGEMEEAEFISFLTGTMTHARDFSLPGSVHYWAMDWRHLHELTLAARAVYERQLNLCVWAKTSAGMGSFYRSQYELFGVFTHGGTHHRNNVQLGRFGRSRSNVWTYPGANNFGRGSDEGNPLDWHPTVKPLALIADILLDASARGDIAVDPFLGSGTTIIAAEKLGRRAYGFELDPLYCDTIIRRWQRWTGEEAIRLNDGAGFKLLEADYQQGDVA